MTLLASSAAPVQLAVVWHCEIPVRRVTGVAKFTSDPPLRYWA
jgi:hypothetical protein